MKPTAYRFTLAWLTVFVAFLVCAGSAPAQPNERVLYGFTGANLDGIEPESAPIVDAAGNLYGTTYYGGYIKACENENSGFVGCGTVFELSPPTSPGGAWTETHLHTFSGGDGGEFPAGSLVFDQAGNLYGMTSQGGSDGEGTVFELSPPAAPGEQWTATLLYNFGTVAGVLIGNPTGPLVFDEAGNLYGTAAGGSADGGVVFELTPSDGVWTLSIVYNFQKSGYGSSPTNGVIFDRSGNLYGTISEFGVPGSVFRLSPSSGGSWTETVLHTFTDGDGPVGSLLFTNGALYGATEEGGDWGLRWRRLRHSLPTGAQW
jgi:uncharacterized repeat protein (TIGR03803 family)